jgi:NUMOD4 motif./HNH endonuclease.
MDINEVWKDIPGFQNIYQASNLGKIRSKDHFVKGYLKDRVFKKGRILKNQITKRGYHQVSLMIEPKQKYNTGVHRLVALAFISNPEKKPQVNHIDCDKENNCVENLEWVTNAENNIHAIKNNLMNPNLGEKNHNSKLSNVEVIQIRELIKAGATLLQLSKQYKMSSSALCNIKHNKTYINIK